MILEGAPAKVKVLISNKLEVFQYLISPCIPNQLEPMSKFLKVEDASIFRSETLLPKYSPRILNTSPPKIV